jgi:molybdenum cofactor cytidylyltransferase
VTFLDATNVPSEPSPDRRQSFAVVPAAGDSVRMGQPKLLLPVGGQPLIWHTLAAWVRSSVSRIVVVVRPADDALSNCLSEFKVQGSKFKAAGHLDVVVPRSPPPDMKASLQAALTHIQQHHSPTGDDAFLVAPADMPNLSTPIINRLLARHSGDIAVILAPTIAGRRGHPVLIPWPLAPEAFALQADEGLNTIIDRQTVELVPCDDLAGAGESAFADIDTPDQYQQLANPKWLPTI